MMCEHLKVTYDNTWENFECVLPASQDCPYLEDMKVKCEIKKVVKELAYENDSGDH